MWRGEGVRSRQEELIQTINHITTVYLYSLSPYKKNIIGDEERKQSCWSENNDWHPVRNVGMPYALARSLFIQRNFWKTPYLRKPTSLFFIYLLRALFISSTHFFGWYYDFCFSYSRYSALLLSYQSIIISSYIRGSLEHLRHRNQSGWPSIDELFPFSWVVISNFLYLFMYILFLGDIPE